MGGNDLKSQEIQSCLANFQSNKEQIEIPCLTVVGIHKEPDGMDTPHRDTAVWHRNVHWTQ